MDSLIEWVWLVFVSFSLLLLLCIRPCVDRALPRSFFFCLLPPTLRSYTPPEAPRGTLYMPSTLEGREDVVATVCQRLPSGTQVTSSV